jgi:hypothetical protein
MPSSQGILEQLGMIANRWWSIAAAWHVVFGGMFIALAGGWRPSHRLLAVIVVPALASVSAVAWSAGNPFNGAVFAMLAVALTALMRTLPAGPIRLSSPATLSVAAALSLFSLIYPHFSPTESWVRLLLVAPLGLIPCPTLSMLVAVTLMARGFHSTRWSVILSAAGLIYGVIGVFALRVGIDVVLIAGALILSLTPAESRSIRTVIALSRSNSPASSRIGHQS